LPLKQPGKLARDNPWKLLLIFILHSCTTKCKTVDRIWACAR
jgi:hypothetical protein